MTVMTWSDDRVEQLKKLWEAGLSASQIAAELGNVTRNAVIGKVHRLGPPTVRRRVVGAQPQVVAALLDGPVAGGPGDPRHAVAVDADAAPRAVAARSEE